MIYTVMLFVAAILAVIVVWTLADFVISMALLRMRMRNIRKIVDKINKDMEKKD